MSLVGFEGNLSLAICFCGFSVDLSKWKTSPTDVAPFGSVPGINKGFIHAWREVDMSHGHDIGICPFSLGFW